MPNGRTARPGGVQLVWVVRGGGSARTRRGSRRRGPSLRAWLENLSKRQWHSSPRDVSPSPPGRETGAISKAWKRGSRITAIRFSGGRPVGNHAGPAAGVPRPLQFRGRRGYPAGGHVQFAGHRAPHQGVLNPTRTATVLWATWGSSCAIAASSRRGGQLLDRALWERVSVSPRLCALCRDGD